MKHLEDTIKEHEKLIETMKTEIDKQQESIVDFEMQIGDLQGDNLDWELRYQELKQRWLAYISSFGLA